MPLHRHVSSLPDKRNHRPWKRQSRSRSRSPVRSDSSFSYRDPLIKVEPTSDSPRRHKPLREIWRTHVDYRDRSGYRDRSLYRDGSPTSTADDDHVQQEQQQQQPSQVDITYPKNFPNKPLTCFFWKQNGRCNKSDADCVYAHWDTGFMASSPISLSTATGTAKVAGKRAQRYISGPLNPETNAYEDERAIEHREKGEILEDDAHTRKTADSGKIDAVGARLQEQSKAMSLRSRELRVREDELRLKEKEFAMKADEAEKIAKIREEDIQKKEEAFAKKVAEAEKIAKNREKALRIKEKMIARREEALMKAGTQADGTEE